ncbi:hypothetical protein Ae168Ps1_4839c [Pseudonocardia sp. Ae168_Ps1]|uniref:hypothetical protein n=1 Tax=Pseudonocardia TaxID=1847 RepID=UPI000963CC5F|nr:MULTISPECIES: hypothetical protein [unclassified Pseudonocardia]OLL76423.1 hypothetical protein Ae150APs1_4801c [Pseudonocardia sp. Ae150A_Ps1]OLL82433.1 hypothetical protein Ae168Ps1_4839c [Pseudonocardia sp. Ae168_Ps1]OLL83452.1 hypothetical protein Ae263Ps1_0507 [Pseudonocardia sp. Ae263_Ps1]OLL90508.1 hypothetical protein Ae356Ps1_0405c [Pseudonocardia sp. Ae356_Ps1]
MNGQTIAVALGVLAGLVLMWSWAAGARAGRKVQKSIHHAGRTGNNAARIVMTAAVVVGVQWAVVKLSADPVAWVIVLGVPALIAGVTVARMLAGPDDVVRVSSRGVR